MKNNYFLLAFLKTHKNYFGTRQIWFFIYATLPLFCLRWNLSIFLVLNSSCRAMLLIAIITANVNVVPATITDKGTSELL
jgi:hypothetical protein